MTKDEAAIIEHAIKIIEAEWHRESTDVLADPNTTKTYLRLKTEHLEHEVFGALFLDTRHRVIATELMFRGTIDGATVHPREVVKACLGHNAAAIIFFHNHPSGIAEPSDADRRITTRLRDALALIDVRVLDHFVIAHAEMVSFAERGFI